jgi:1,4-dihydroxy-2-naphthoate octaprenyltransferase
MLSTRSAAVIAVAAAAATAAASCVVFFISGSASSLSYVAAAVLIAFSYSAPPLHLKARALGDVAVFISFGPLPSAFMWHVTTGSAPPVQLLVLSVPFGLWAMAVLHRNNMRDADHDAAVGTTLAILLGKSRSRQFFRSLLTLCVVSGSVGMLYASSALPPAASTCVASAAAILLLVGFRLTSNVMALEPQTQPQDVAAAAGAWAVCYLIVIYAAGVRYDEWVVQHKV